MDSQNNRCMYDDPYIFVDLELAFQCYAFVLMNTSRKPSVQVDLKKWSKGIMLWTLCPSLDRRSLRVPGSNYKAAHEHRKRS